MPAYHLPLPGLRPVICVYTHQSEADFRHQPQMLHRKPGNQLSRTSQAIPVQVG